MEEKRKIISIEEDEAQPDGCGLERFLQEVNILELEGVYFSPSRKTVSTGTKAKTLAELYSQPVTITLSSYGQPGELALPCHVLPVAGSCCESARGGGRNGRVTDRRLGG